MTFMIYFTTMYFGIRNMPDFKVDLAIYIMALEVLVCESVSVH